MQATEVVAVPLVKTLADVCATLQLPKATCEDLQRVFMTPEILAQTVDADLAAGLQMLRQEMSPMALLTIRSRCREQCSVSQGTGDLRSNAATEAASDAAEVVEAKQRLMQPPPTLKS